SYAVQLAKHIGAEVTGECSTGKVDLVRLLGADHVIDYTREDFAAGGRRYDLIIDIAGNPPLSRLRRALTPTGTVVIVGAENAGKLTGMTRQLGAALLSPFVGQRLTSVVSKEQFSVLERLRQLIEKGAVSPSIDLSYPLSQASDAMRRLAAGSVQGKVAITI
ncbi:MAG: NAD(P)-dependent alcohol dehydrogenase, partial [Nakamurella sp.]